MKHYMTVRSKFPWSSKLWYCQKRRISSQKLFTKIKCTLNISLTVIWWFLSNISVLFIMFSLIEEGESCLEQGMSWPFLFRIILNYLKPCTIFVTIPHGVFFVFCLIVWSSVEIMGCTVDQQIGRYIVSTKSQN